MYFPFASEDNTKLATKDDEKRTKEDRRVALLDEPLGGEYTTIT